MPDFVSKGAVPLRHKPDGIHIPGIYEWWHRSRCAHRARYAMVERDHDPRFVDAEAPFDDTAREARLAEARRVAEATAAQAITRGKPVAATLLRPRHRLGVWWDRGSGVRIPSPGFESDALYNIWPDDLVS